MMDSTNAEVPGFVKARDSIGPALDQAFAQATRKIIVASFSSHVHRVQQVVDAARAYGRKVVRRPFDGAQYVHRRDLAYLHILDTAGDLKCRPTTSRDKPDFMCTGSSYNRWPHSVVHRRRQPPRYPHHQSSTPDSRQP